jgi:hypothetical protein
MARVHIGVESERARGAQILLPGQEVFAFAEVAACRLGGNEDVLAEAQDAVGIGRVERNDVGEALHLGAARPVAKIEIEVVLSIRRRRRSVGSPDEAQTGG